MTQEEKDILRELAEAATPGSWNVEENIEYSPDILAGDLIIATTLHSDMPRQMDAINAAYISAASPDAIIQILDDIEEALSDVEDLGALLVETEHNFEELFTRLGCITSELGLPVDAETSTILEAIRKQNNKGTNDDR